MLVKKCASLPRQHEDLFNFKTYLFTATIRTYAFFHALQIFIVIQSFHDRIQGKKTIFLQENFRSV